MGLDIEVLLPMEGQVPPHSGLSGKNINNTGWFVHSSEVVKLEI